MKGRMLVYAAFAATMGPADLKSQKNGATQENLVAAEAVRAALKEAKLTGSAVRIVIDPNIGYADEAPQKTHGLRSAARNEYLRTSFGASLRPRPDVVSCLPHRKCELRDADVLITLSDPTIVGNEASITVTVEQGGSRRLFAVTNRLHLKRVGGVWKVERIEQLGIA